MGGPNNKIVDINSGVRQHGHCESMLLLRKSPGRKELFVKNSGVLSWSIVSFPSAVIDGKCGRGQCICNVAQPTINRDS